MLLLLSENYEKASELPHGVGAVHERTWHRDSGVPGAPRRLERQFTAALGLDHVSVLGGHLGLLTLKRLMSWTHR